MVPPFSMSSSFILNFFGLLLKLPTQNLGITHVFHLSSLSPFGGYCPNFFYWMVIFSIEEWRWFLDTVAIIMKENY